MATVRSAVDIMGEWYQIYRDLPDFQDFFTQYDVGVPLAYVCWLGMATPSDEGVKIIDQTWQAFCEMFDIDHYTKIDNWADFEDLALSGT